MGFSLASFFHDLEMLLSEPEMPDAEKLRDLAFVITAAKAYAQECGQFPESEPGSPS